MHLQICLLSSATPTDWSAVVSLDTCAHVQRSHYYMIPRLPAMAGNQSLRGYYPYGAHLARASQPKIVHFLLHTSKPLSRLVNASFKPLVAEEIFLSTALINERCSSESATRSRRPVSTSGRTPNCPGPFSSPPVGAERSGLRAADVLASGFGRTRLLCDDTSVSPAS